MVDDVAGGVGGCVPLDRDLGNVLDMMVNLVSNMVDNWGGGNGNRSSVDNWGSVSNGNWSSMSVGGNWGGMSIGGNWGSMSISGNWGSMGYGGDSWSGNGMSSRVDTSNKTMAISSSKEVLSISISNWGSKATANKSREDNKALHLDQC